MWKECITSSIFICVIRTCLGSVRLTCNDMNPTELANGTCTCTNSEGSGVRWNINGVYLTDCIKSNEQCFASTGYSFSVNKTTSTFDINIVPYSYTSCTNISCQDLTSATLLDSQIVSVADFMPMSSPVMNEPINNNENGLINFTSECLYKDRSDGIIINVQWLAVVEGTEKSFHPQQTTILKTGSCQYCDQDFATQLFIGFYHEESTNEDRQEAHVRIIVEHNGYPSLHLNVTSANKYYLDVATSKVISDSWCIIAEKEVSCISVIGVVVGVLIIQIVVVIVVIQKRKETSTRRKCLYLFPVLGIIAVIFVLCTIYQCEISLDVRTHCNYKLRAGRKTGPT